METIMKAFLISALFLTGCSLKEYGNNADTSASVDDLTDFAGGQFQMTSRGVDDNCADGSFETLLMPEGTSTPTDWAYPIEIPDWETMATRVTYEINLQDPFSAMLVTLVQGDSEGLIEMSGGSQESVPLFDDDSCFVDLSISATLQIVSNDELTGQATLVFDDSSGMNCNFEPGCEMLLDFTGTRL